MARTPSGRDRFLVQATTFIALANDELYAEGMLDAFDELGYGAILLSRSGTVLQSNNEAKRHLDDAIKICRDKLAARDGNANESLQKLIASVVAAAGAPRDTEANAVVVPRRAGRPVVAYATPLSAGSREELPEAAGIILLVDPDGHREPAEAILQQAFDLTPAETRLALGLARGHDLQAISELNGVGVGTLRIQLKSIFSKTQTSRQAELVSLLSKFSLAPSRADLNGAGSNKLPRDL